MSEHTTKTDDNKATRDYKIQSFQDLLEEEQRLIMHHKRSKARVNEDLNLVKQKLQPANQALNFMTKMAGGTGRPTMMSQGLDIAVDLLTKKYLFKRSNWFITLAGSYLIRGISQLILPKKKRDKEWDARVRSDGQNHSGKVETVNQ